MIDPVGNPAIAALRNPAALPGWTIPQWEGLIRHARRADLLSRIGVMLRDAGSLPSVPAAPRAHLQAALVVAEAQEQAVRREVEFVCKALTPLGIDVVLLKGAAYLYGDLPVAKGRIFTDVDILVPRAALPEVEAALMLHGWATTHHDPYDQRYYRQWMHELPPLRHVKRATVLDVHHGILPETARSRPDSARLLAASIPVAGSAILRVLAPVDMVLHSAIHLFHNEELSHGLRDVADLDGLLRHFATQQDFWQMLETRASELHAMRPLYYGLRYSKRIFGTPVPEHALRASDAGAPSAIMRRPMDELFLRALQPDHPDAADAFTPLARLLLYVRAHWLRMPPLLLARHLTVKALRRESD